MQDRPENVERGKKEIYPNHALEALSYGCMQLMVHDSLQPNLVKIVGVH